MVGHAACHIVPGNKQIIDLSTRRILKDCELRLLGASKASLQGKGVTHTYTAVKAPTGN